MYQSPPSPGTRRPLPQEVAVAITCNGTTQAVMMATPQDLADFAHGFALSEGLIRYLGDVEEFELVEHPKGIEARFWLAPAQAKALGARRRIMAGPVGCGLCGIDSLDEAMREVPAVKDEALRLSGEEIASAPEALRAFQPLHDASRGVHAAGFLQPGAGVTLAREDVGRHNALDKLTGALLLAGTAPSGGAVVITSRVSIDLVQKVALAGSPMLIAVSTPTQAAVDAAEGAGLTLIARVRGGGFEVFSHRYRVG
ncbi:formate dehydrogenase accessory sulfurtransferase FdhD [Pseudoroseicyclus aestuarii]|uniref:Sulfur carrier protein FdhD n=1 Tax=Pseudoroseicyclus aestuarii TaxID=1795041 RepID=A0A318STX1_9RHOB|nr:formate dehydrogenase accessory sulfurtransferase FdhD [Pseudoroseicyclus aestuarii]PYE85103.1 FdhD protein [Pseudoroseicyclus aestuarii]